MSWHMAKLGDVCLEDKTVTDGKSSSRPYLGLEMIESETGMINWSNSANEGISTCYAFDSRHILYGKLRPYLNKVALPTIEGRCSTEIIPLLPKSEICREYIAFILRCEETIDYVMPEITGSRMPRANMNHLFDMEIPLPPIDEQRLIATEIERQLAIAGKAKQAASEQLMLLDCLRAKHIESTFSNNFLSGCEWVSINDCATKIGSGATPRGGQNSYYTSGIPFIRSQNVHFNAFSSVGLVYINEKQNEELRNTAVQFGDILLNITGASIGRVCVVPDEFCPANVNQHVCIIRIDNNFIPEFVAYYMTTTRFQAEILELQTGATRQALTKEQVQNFKLPLVDKPKQELILSEIKAKINSVRNLHKCLSHQRVTINAIPAAILRQAFIRQM